MNRNTYITADVENPHRSDERELYCSVVEKLNEFLKYMKHNKLNLSQDEISNLQDILSVTSMSLDNYV